MALFWIWLTPQRGNLVFNYGRSYLERSEAISIYDVERPLRAGVLPLLPGLSMPNGIRDAAPDAWGRRVLINRLLGARGAPLSAELGAALQHGTAIGGARPKALIEHGKTKYVAKFSSSTDVYSVVRRSSSRCASRIMPGSTTARPRVRPHPAWAR